MLRQIVAAPWFAFADLLLVAVSGISWIWIPELGIWFTLLAFLPWGMRMLAGYSPFKRTRLDWLLLLFLITAWVGYWAAYDKGIAWNKAWFIVTAILLYYALNIQPKQNWMALSWLSFGLGLGVAIHFFLSFNFDGISSSLVSWWLMLRPQTGLHAIHHGYTCGLLVITNLFAMYGLQNLKQKKLTPFTVVSWIFVFLTIGLVLIAFMITVSRGVWAAAACGVGAWVIWRVVTWKRLALESRLRPLFPMLVLLYISLIIAFVYLGPAQAGGTLQADYGTNSRADVFTRGLYFLLDYPFTGAGLGSFPGTYSQYMLAIPHFYFINSYNMFLDVAIEQGWLGGWVFMLICLGSVWQVCQSIVKTQSRELRMVSWISLFALIFTFVHGLFYDYLYNGIGTLLLFFPMGFAMTLVSSPEHFGEDVQLTEPFVSPHLNRATILGLIVGGLLLSFFNFNKIASLFYSNLGAVQMSQVELRDFPTSEWATAEILPNLEKADASFQTSLRYNPSNETANYRLGLISMLRQDFESAVLNLENSYQELPGHRGIVKNLGYCYIWLGELDKGENLLENILETEAEMSVYSWWWGVQGRRDLANNAFQLSSRLAHENTQP